MLLEWPEGRRVELVGLLRKQVDKEVSDPPFPLDVPTLYLGLSMGNTKNIYI